MIPPGMARRIRETPFLTKGSIAEIAERAGAIWCMANLAIWWLNADDVEVLMGIEMRSPEYMSYVVDEVHSMRGRPKRGRLWVPPGFPLSEIPWPENPTSMSLKAEKCGGIVVRWQDVQYMQQRIGFFTNLALEEIALGEADHVSSGATDTTH